MTRKDTIKELDSLCLIDKDNKSFGIMGSHKFHVLNNLLTSKDCQIIEMVGMNGGKEIDVGKHIHEKSTEIFYQLSGTTYFHDGTHIKEGEIKLISPNEQHNLHIQGNGSVVIIIHPVDEKLRLLTS